jgi:hypothetical protein
MNLYCVLLKKLLAIVNKGLNFLHFLLKSFDASKGIIMNLK